MSWINVLDFHSIGLKKVLNLPKATIHVLIELKKLQNIIYLDTAADVSIN